VGPASWGNHVYVELDSVGVRVAITGRGEAREYGPWTDVFTGAGTSL
jgi:hypothetical protein